LLPGESDATTQQEREECMQAFRDTADHVLSRHHKAFLGAFKQMMVAVFGPGMEQMLNKTPIHGGTMGIGESSSNRHCSTSQPSLLLRAPGAKLSSLLRKVLGVSQFSPHYRPQEDDQSSHHRRAARVNLCNSRTRTSPCTESWHRLAWSSACFRLQDCSSKQQAAEEFARRRLPRGGKLRSHRCSPESRLRTSCGHTRG
jgi:hypothetical protein